MRQKIKSTLLLASFVLGQSLFYSCHIAHDREIICEQNFKKASAVAYNDPTNNSALNSSLTILNRCMQCDSIKAAVVELKIRLLINLGKFKEGSEFTDSLSVSDFIYPYKKKLNHDNFIVLNFTSVNDTISRKKVLREMASKLESYINSNNLKSKEFQEAFIDLTTIDSTVLYRQIDSLKIKYPNEAKFLDFFKP